MERVLLLFALIALLLQCNGVIVLCKMNYYGPMCQSRFSPNNCTPINPNILEYTVPKDFHNILL